MREHPVLAEHMDSLVSALELLRREAIVELTRDEYVSCFIELLVRAYSPTPVRAFASRPNITAATVWLTDS